MRGVQTYRYFVSREHVETTPLESRHAKSSNFEIEGVVRNPLP